jgi:hypothetical protein
MNIIMSNNIISGNKKCPCLTKWSEDMCNCHLGIKLNDCGCCEGIKTYTPADMENPPSLSSIRYRVGTHGAIKTSMLANLSKNQDNSALSKLNTRADNDLAIAIIDSWATIADVVTFYQERVANEGFLRTSTERMSVLELARSIGYELGPGAASDTLLAFMLEENNPGIAKSIIEIGTKVQSVPQQGETLQTFETIERLEARPELNQIKANTRLPHIVDKNTDALYFHGVDTKLRQDDRLLIIGKTEGKYFQFFANVLNVKPDEKKNITIAKIQIVWPTKYSHVTSGTGSTHTGGATKNTTIDSLQDISNIHDNNNNNQNVPSSKDAVPTKSNKISTGAHILGNEINLSQIASMAVQKDVSESDLIEDQNKAMEEHSKSLAPKVYVFREKASIFGHDAPSFESITLGNPDLANLSDWDSPELPIFKKVKITLNIFEKYSTSDDRPIVFLDNVYENIISKNYDDENISDNWIVFTGIDQGVSFGDNRIVLPLQVESTKEETLVEYAVSGKATGIQLRTLNKSQQTELGKFRRRNTTVYIQSERLDLAGKIDEAPVEGDFIELEKGVAGLEKNRIVIITGEILDQDGRPTGKTRSEPKKLREITTKKIFFDTELDNKYLRESVRIYANVVPATHGETQREVLGSGDPTVSQQTFTLRQKPLTYIKSSTKPNGALSSLEVRVDDILWREVDYLYGTGQKDRVFVTRNEDNGSTNILFGDGKRGLRPFTGLENITAKYRIGTGRDGLLKQNQLSILMDRPLGVKSVTNPLPTSAPEDPENLESARTNAPLKVLTMNRIVSLSDFENFARCFAGIGKAKASKIWNGSKTIVHLSVASSSGQKLDPLTSKNIKKSIEMFKDPQIQFVVDSFIKKTFSLTVKIKVREDMISEKVFMDVKNTILDTFSFKKRQFGQYVTLSEVITLIQNVPGVIFADLDELYSDVSNEELLAAESSGQNGIKKQVKIKQNRPERYLACSLAYYDYQLNKIKPAEIMIVNPQGVILLNAE